LVAVLAPANARAACTAARPNESIRAATSCDELVSAGMTAF
jgi:hypothetical protein